MHPLQPGCSARRQSAARTSRRRAHAARLTCGWDACPPAPLALCLRPCSLPPDLLEVGAFSLTSRRRTLAGSVSAAGAAAAPAGCLDVVPPQPAGSEVGVQRLHTPCKGGPLLCIPIQTVLLTLCAGHWRHQGDAGGGLRAGSLAAVGWQGLGSAPRCLPPCACARHGRLPRCRPRAEPLRALHVVQGAPSRPPPLPAARCWTSAARTASPATSSSSRLTK